VIAPIADFLCIVATSALFRLAVMLVALAALVRLKIKIGRVLVISPFIAAALFPNHALPGNFAASVTADGGAFFFSTLMLVALFAMIDIFGRALKEVERLPRLMRALQALFRDRRIALAGMPAVIGFLPMPGGAMVSAPLVEEVATESGGGISAEEKTLVNYWFRHIWEYFFPLYPAVVAAAAIWQVDLGGLIVRQLVLSFAAVAGGLVFVLRPVSRRARGADVRPDGASSSDAPPAPDGGPPDAKWTSHVGDIASGVAPIAAVIVIWLALREIGPYGRGWIAWKPWGTASVVLAIVPVTAALIVAGRVERKWLWARLKGCMPLDMALLLVGAMLLKTVVASSGMVGDLAEELTGLRVPMALVIFLLPFAAGMLTGMAVAFVTATFGLLAGVLATGAGPDPAATVLAFASGYVGVLLSPVHICLVLTRDYFGAKLGAVYLRLLPPAAVVLGVAFVVYFTQTRL